MSDEAPRRRGRPPLAAGESTTAVRVRILSRDYDRAYQLAQREGASVSDVLRRGIARAVAPDDDED